MKVKYFSIIFLFVLLQSCVSGPPKDAFVLSPTSLENRQLQSRFFETTDEIAIISAGIGVFQDMGYAIDQIEKMAGVVSASKNVDATDGGQIAAAVLVALLGGGNMATDKEQKITASLVTTPSTVKENGFVARVAFQRVIWDNRGNISRVETLVDSDIYMDFFQKLSKSVFLEAFKI